MPNGTEHPSGEQHELRSGEQTAVVTEVGATLRSYSANGSDVLDGFGVDEPASGSRGQVLAPWPNRLDGGRYAFEGIQGRAPIDEPERNNAIHGLVRGIPWEVESREVDAVTLGCVLEPQPAYPWRLELAIAYRLSADGLTVRPVATNRSDAPAPFGIGFHPYLTLGVPVDEVRLRIPASLRLLTDERQLPVGEEEVFGTASDYREPRPIGSARLDDCFTGIIRDADGRWRVPLVSGDRSTEVWADEGFGYVQAYTGDTLDPVSRRRRSIAIEPMSCPPNAFVSGVDVIRLEPGGTWSGAWGITPDRSR
jgi:aldose 1-epimerase